ncbi:MAG: hypothetical protein HY288_08055 [Planctomycetia bacterium]|nr:hypothetical protein [Planctomycetia bacterium]
MNGHRLLACPAGICVAIASVAGCAMLGSNESQLFSRTSRYESASITYRVTPVAPGNAPLGAPLTAYQAPTFHGANSSSRKTMLAVRYPHPAGRAGFARVELIVQASKSDAPGTSAWMPNWLDRVRRFAHESLPGVSMAEGVQEALGLDLPVADLDRVVARLQQPVQTASGVESAREVLIAAKINGAPLALANVRVAELDGLVARVRREGSLISHSSSTIDWELDSQPGPASPQAASAIIPASYSSPAIQRLPPVEVIPR